MSHRKGPMHSFDGDPLDNRRSDIWKRFGFNHPEEDHDMFFETTPPAWSEFQNKFHRSDPEWRNRTMFTEPSSSNPFPNRMRMGPKWAAEDENGIPIRVVHERTPPRSDEGTDSETSSQASHGSQGSSSNGQPMKAKITREPRVHHIPIMVEPRDGSTSSGYASDSGGANTHGASVKTEQQDIRKRAYPNETIKKQSSVESTTDSGDYPPPNVQELRKSFEHRKLEDDNENVSQQSTQESSTNARQIPIKVLNSNASPNKMQSPKNKQPPARSFSANSFAATPGPSAPPRQRKASSHPPMSPPSSFSNSTNGPRVTKASSGPHVTKIPMNVSEPSQETSTENLEDEETKNPKTKHDSLQLIADVLAEKEKFRKHVDQYQGTTQDKQYRYLDEMLTRLMLKLDNVETEGREDVRQARKSAVREIESCLSYLESKLHTSAHPQITPHTNNVDSINEGSVVQEMDMAETINSDDNMHVDQETENAANFNRKELMEEPGTNQNNGMENESGENIPEISLGQQQSSE